MSDDGLDRMWGDSPERPEDQNSSSSSHVDRERRPSESGQARGDETPDNLGPQASERVDERQDDRPGSDANSEPSQRDRVSRGDPNDSSKAGPSDKKEIPTRKKQFVIREDQDRALNRALASESCEYGDNRSDVIQALLDLHGFHE